MLDAATMPASQIMPRRAAHLVTADLRLRRRIFSISKKLQFRRPGRLITQKAHVLEHKGTNCFYSIHKGQMRPPFPHPSGSVPIQNIWTPRTAVDHTLSIQTGLSVPEEESFNTT